MAEGGASGPPDLISGMVQPVDLVNSVTRSVGLHQEIQNILPHAFMVRPAVVNLQQPPVMPVDIVEDLPAHVNGDDSPAEAQGGGGDTVGDHLDARWFSRGSGAPGAPHGGISCVQYL